MSSSKLDKPFHLLKELRELVELQRMQNYAHDSDEFVEMRGRVGQLVERLRKSVVKIDDPILAAVIAFATGFLIKDAEHAFDISSKSVQ